MLWLAILFWVAPQIVASPWRWLLLVPMLRMADVLYTMMVLLVEQVVPRDSARALVLAVVHYLELAVIFACAYLATFSSTPGGCLCGTYSTNDMLFPSEFLYFSIITAATVGYGDIHLVPSPDCAATRWLIMAAPFIFLLISALMLPRAVAGIINLQRQKSPPGNDVG